MSVIFKINETKIGLLIRKLRKEKQMNQDELANLVHVTRQAVSAWEQGKNLPDIESLVELACVFEVTLDELIRGEQKRPSIN